MQEIRKSMRRALICSPLPRFGGEGSGGGGVGPRGPRRLSVALPPHPSPLPPKRGERECGCGCAAPGILRIFGAPRAQTGHCKQTANVDEAKPEKEPTMFFSSWLRKPNAKPQTNRWATSTFRPRVEVLEGRYVPSTLAVTNNLDNGSVGSLRYEVAQAKKGDTIIFAPSLDGQTITLGGAELDITKSLTIQGPGAGLLTINGGADGIDNNVGARVFAVENKTNVTLSGL